MDTANSGSLQQAQLRRAKLWNVLLIVVVLLLVYQNYRLNKRAHLFEKPTTLSIGEYAPALELRNTSTNVIKVFDNTTDSLDRLILLYIFSTTCSACETNFRKWAVIDSTLQILKMAGYYVSMDTVENLSIYAREKKISGEIYAPVTKDFEKIYKITGLPITLAIDNTRKVQYAYLGVLSTSEVKRIIQLAQRSPRS
jgi:hypothetical protein